MKKNIWMYGVVAMMSTSLLCAQEAPLGQGAVDEKTLKENYRRLEEQHLVAVVLANQYNKELAELRRMEAVFCDQYGLDVAKWRNNGYIWLEDQKKFALRSEVAETPAGTPALEAPAELKAMEAKKDPRIGATSKKK